MAKVALCIYMCGKIYQSHDHLGLSSIAGALKNAGHEVDFFYIDSNNEDTILEEVKAFTPDYVGFTIYSANIANSIRFSRRLKEHSDYCIVFGGPTPTYEGKEILTLEDSVDIIVKGEGELTFVKLIKLIAENGSLADCKGICWRNSEGEVVDNPHCPLLSDLDELPFPYRMEKRVSNVAHFNLETSRGCLANCSFCNSKYSRIQFGKAWRGKSISRVMQEIEESIKRYNVNRFNIVDLSFEDPGVEGRSRVNEFVEELKKRNLKIYYTSHFRAEFLTEENMPLILKMIESGLTKVSLGIEAGNNHSLKIYNKIATVEDNRRAVGLMNGLEIPMIHGFINFNPYTTFDDIRENARFLLDCKWAYRIEDFCSTVEVFPGTPIKEMLIKDGLIDREFSYKNRITGYNFQDKRVGWLSTFFSGLLKRNNIDIDFGLFTESFLFETAELFKRKSIPEKITKALAEFRMFYKEIIELMNRQHYDFFMRIVELAEGKESYETFEEEALKVEQELIGDSITINKKKIEEKKLKFAWLAMKNNVTLSD